MTQKAAGIPTMLMTEVLETLTRHTVLEISQSGGKLKSFKQRVADNDTIICAEGYLFELERRGYCKAGPYVPDVILNRPEVITSIHEEFAHAGSDILVACLYYVNRWKLSTVGLENEFEAMNKKALQLCRDSADKTNTLMAGNLCNSVEFNISDGNSIQEVYDMFKEQVVWAVDLGSDLMICETFRSYTEASLALRAVNEFGGGTPSVVSLAPYNDVTEDKISFPDAMNKLYYQGANVVGLNCARGPNTMMPLLEDIRKSYQGPLSCNPVPYRTIAEEPSWAMLTDKVDGKSVHPVDLDCVGCSCADIKRFGKEAKQLGVNYLGICCGNSSRYTRALAESVGHACPASNYTSELSESVIVIENMPDKVEQIIKRKYSYRNTKIPVQA